MAVMCHQAGLLAGEGTGQIDCGQPPRTTLWGEPGVTSLRKNAVVGIGGEVSVDYTLRKSKSSSIAPDASTIPLDASVSDMALKHATLRIRADVHPSVSAFIKLDFGSHDDRHDEDIVEEAMLVMSAVGGTGLGFFAGRGRAPYGQDIALGMVQSYHHNANQWDSSEGLIFINDPPLEKKDPADPDQTPREQPPMRPGQFDRVFMAGASYTWHDRWKIELAAFQPNMQEYEDRLSRVDGNRNPANIGAAGRIWWRPFEDLVLQFSAMATRSNDMARIRLRTDIDLGAGARGADTAYAVSAGFDWRRGPWRVFGEYQHGWDWNFTKGYDTDTWQVGAARDLTDNLRVGAMVEGLHIDDGARAVRVKHDYYKLALNVRYTFDNGVFLLAEYGHEWMRRERGGSLDERRRGDFIGVRMGMSF